MMLSRAGDPVERYVGREAATVPGYLRSLDLAVLALIGRHQSASGIRGGLFEIGVHHGKLFLLLARLRQAGERALGVDLFEDDDINRRGRHSDRPTALIRHAARLGIPLDEREVWRSDSTRVAAAQVLERIGPARVVSVDGGHGYNVVKSDLALAADVLSPDGIIAVDDYCNRDWPDVRDATDEFLAGESCGLAAFLLTPGKLYLAPRAWVAHYAGVVDGHAPFAALRRSTAVIGGHEVAFLRWGYRARLARRVAEAVRFAAHVGRATTRQAGMILALPLVSLT